MATNPLNPKKKHRKMNKAKAKLDARIKDYEATIKLPNVEAKAFRRPGSLKIR